MEALSKYLAPTVMADLRSRRGIATDLARDLHRTPFIDDLRDQVTLEDKELLFELVESAEKPVAVFALGLLMNIRDHPAVRSLFFELWRRTDDVSLGVRLTFRLADYDDLSLNEHREIYEFVKANWEPWIAAVASYYEPDKLLEKTEERITGDKFPRTKLWLQLCKTCAAPDKEETIQFIRRYEGSDLPLVAEVVDDLMARLRPDEGPAEQPAS